MADYGRHDEPARGLWQSRCLGTLDNIIEVWDNTAMSNDTLTALLDALRETPRMTPPELSEALGRTITNADLKALQARGLVAEYGTRVTGKRGRPPIEWVIAGTVVSDSAEKAVDAAREAVDNYNDWMASSNKLWHLREDGQGDSDAYAEAYCDHYDRWPMGTVPPTPTDNQMLLAGVRAPKDAPEPDEAYEVESVPVLA